MKNNNSNITVTWKNKPSMLDGFRIMRETNPVLVKNTLVKRYQNHVEFNVSGEESTKALEWLAAASKGKFELVGV